MSGQLGRLLAQATPGPWVWEPMLPPNTRVAALRSTTAFYEEYRGVPRGVLKRLDYAAEPDTRLIALTPTLARLLVDAMAVLATVCDQWACKDPDCPCSAGKTAALLARFAEVEQQAGEGQG